MSALPFTVLALLLLQLFHPVHAFNELSGTSLVGCVLLEPPYIIPDNDSPFGYGGVAMEYLAHLERNLGFTITFKLWEKSWSEFIKTMSICGQPSQPPCPCNIGVGSFTMTNERSEAINFIAPFSNEAHHMVGRKADLRVDDSQNTWFAFKTFTTEVWILIACGVFMHAIGTVFYGPFRPPSSATHQIRSAGGPRRFQLSDIIWQIKRFPAAVLFAYSHLVGHPFGERAQKTPSFHRSAWLVLGVTTGLFLLTIYEASLTVLLFESTKTSPFRTLQDLTDCAVSPEKVAIIAGGASQDFWNLAVNTTQNRRKCPSWNKVGMTVPNMDAGFAAVKDRRANYFYSLEGSVLVRSNRNCEDFEPVGEPFFSTAVAFVMAKNENTSDGSLYHTLSRETRILRQQDRFPTAQLIAARSSCDAVVDATITVGKVLPILVLYSIAWAVLLMYRCVFLWRRRNEPEKESDEAGSGGIEVMNMQSMPTRAISGIAGVTEDRSVDMFDPFDQSEYSRPHTPPPHYPRPLAPTPKLRSVASTPPSRPPVSRPETRPLTPPPHSRPSPAPPNSRDGEVRIPMSRLNYPP